MEVLQRVEQLRRAGAGLKGAGLWGAGVLELQCPWLLVMVVEGGGAQGYSAKLRALNAEAWARCTTPGHFSLFWSLWFLNRPSLRGTPRLNGGIRLQYNTVIKRRCVQRCCLPVRYVSLLRTMDPASSRGPPGYRQHQHRAGSLLGADAAPHVKPVLIGPQNRHGDAYQRELHLSVQPLINHTPHNVNPTTNVPQGTRPPRGNQQLSIWLRSGI
ncbi:hypothetical protein N1851_008198 [Merluccius polli]|uniref:Uncharacterized protein n=1 Tax=Merluccius polli TaxID=89951 RepID=A0AA47N2Z1_MERPO|nr:hypothetical protein N1851_008198 [Merluccius polli]